MAGKRPLPSIAQAVGEADRVWASLRAEDWLEAFAAHPRIGDSGTGAPAKGTSGGLTPGASESSRLECVGSGARETQIAVAETADWSLMEQAQVSSAGPDVRNRLAAANREYEARFGYIFIVCATGKSAEEMLALLERRMTHSPGDELAVAAEEQGRIIRLRLGKLLVA
jgi:2-oxo-4-hydroxy-4-carboxy-5-ureidoimidazoline decarboxylase